MRTQLRRPQRLPLACHVCSTGMCPGAYDKEKGPGTSAPGAGHARRSRQAPSVSALALQIRAGGALVLRQHALDAERRLPGRVGRALGPADAAAALALRDVLVCARELHAPAVQHAALHGGRQPGTRASAAPRAARRRPTRALRTPSCWDKGVSFCWMCGCVCGVYSSERHVPPSISPACNTFHVPLSQLATYTNV